MASIESTLTPVVAIYPQLVGASWDSLHKTLQRFHSEGETVRASGVFRVRHGHNLLARWLARIARMPQEGDAAQVQLVVIRSKNGEEWQRRFADVPLRSSQLTDSGLLVEHIAFLEIWLRIEITDGGLVYRLCRAALRLGSFRLFLPHSCSPRLIASERATGNPDEILVAVEVSMPLLGRLLTYEGILTNIEFTR
jgi:hypothetical protein